jgi:hypothetical protein
MAVFRASQYTLDFKAWAIAGSKVNVVDEKKSVSRDCRPLTMRSFPMEYVLLFEVLSATRRANGK